MYTQATSLKNLRTQSVALNGKPLDEFSEDNGDKKNIGQ
jgi:hypothetical protein